METYTKITEDQSLDIKGVFEVCNQTGYEQENFVQLIELLHSSSDKFVLFAIVGFRKLVSFITNPPIQSIIDANLLPSILGLLTRQDIPRIQFEALWTLTNVASGKEEYVQALLDKGAV